jgi:hypothetical protein
MKPLLKLKFLIKSLNLLANKEQADLYLALENLYIQKQDKSIMEKQIYSSFKILLFKISITKKCSLS